MTIMRTLAAGKHYSPETSLAQSALARLLAGDPNGYENQGGYDKRLAYWTKRLDNGHVNRSNDPDKFPPLHGCFSDGVVNEFDPKLKTAIKWYRSPELEPWEEREAAEQAEASLVGA